MRKLIYILLFFISTSSFSQWLCNDSEGWLYNDGWLWSDGYGILVDSTVLLDENENVQFIEQNIYLTSDQTPIDQNTFIFIIEVGSTIYIDWGNGDESITELNGTGANQNAVSNYSNEGTYRIKIHGDLLAITALTIITEPNLSGHLNVGILTSLTYLQLHTLPNCTINGGEINNLTSLTILYLLFLPNVIINGGEINNLTLLTTLQLLSLPNVTINGGEIGSLTSLITLYLAILPNCTINGGEISLLTSLTYLYLQTLLLVAISNTENFTDIIIYINDCLMTATSVDNTLIRLDALGWINHTVTIAGNNAARTAASDAAKAALLGKGWTIVVNE